MVTWYMSVSSSAGKVSWKRTELNLSIKTLIRWNKTTSSAVRQYAQKSCGPGRPETRQSWPCLSTATGYYIIIKIIIIVNEYD